jgi:hypothetical protein
MKKAGELPSPRGQSRENLRLVGSVEVVVGLVPVTRRGHGLATTVAAGISLSIALGRHTGATKVVALLVPASASRGRTYTSSVSEKGGKYTDKKKDAYLDSWGWRDLRTGGRSPGRC